MKESETVQARMDAYAKTLIEKLKTSEGTWMKPWEDFQGRHQNLWTEAVYRGGNILRTMLHCMTFDKAPTTGLVLKRSRNVDCGSGREQ